MYPHFLGIGAQKAGTSWLHTNLASHPALWLPPRKEIHYFDKPAGIRTLTLWFRGRRHLALRKLIEVAPKVLLPIRGGKLGAPLWHLRYLTGLRGDRWYRSLFQPKAGQIAGEITPAYATLSEEMVAKVAGLMPNVKVLFLLRNPVDRTLSSAAMYFSKVQRIGPEEITEAQWLRFLDRKAVHKRSDYLRTLDIWMRHFHEDQVFVGFFDEISREPFTLLRRVCDFLDVDCASAYFPEAQNRKNARRHPPIPPYVVRHLAGRYLDLLEALQQRFDNAHTACWLRNTREFV